MWWGMIRQTMCQTIYFQNLECSFTGGINTLLGYWRMRYTSILTLIIQISSTSLMIFVLLFQWSRYGEINWRISFPLPPIWCIDIFSCYFVSHMLIHYFLFMHLVPSRFMPIIHLSISCQWCSLFVIWCYLSNLHVDFLPKVNDICGISDNISRSFLRPINLFKSLNKPLKGKNKYFESNWY